MNVRFLVVSSSRKGKIQNNRRDHARKEGTRKMGYHCMHFAGYQSSDLRSSGDNVYYNVHKRVYTGLRSQREVRKGKG